MLYGGKDFAIDDVQTNFDVENWAEHKHKMKPWEVRNAEAAATRRTHLLKWLRAAGGHKEEAINTNSLPLTPAWQSSKEQRNFKKR